MASATKSESKSKLKYRAIMKSMTGLVDVIGGGDPKKLALRLFQEQLLNENTYDELLLESTGTDKARKIVNELLKKVKVNPDERYEKLMEVLTKEEMFDAVKLIKEKYKEELKEESLCRTKRKDSRKRIPSEPSPKSDDSSSDSQGQQIESGSFSSTLDVETDYPYRRSGTKANKPLPEFANRKIDFMTAISVIADVSKYVNLGKQLRVASSKIDVIDQYPPEERKARIIRAWFDHDPNPTYKTLYQALLKPSVDDKRAAMQLFSELSSSIDSSTSVDPVCGESSSIDTTRGGPDLPFNESSVLNAIASISDDYTLGIHLGLDCATLNEIKKYPVNEQKQKLVARWFAVEEPKNCNWTKLNAAINKMGVPEWNDRNIFTSTASLESNASLLTTTRGSGTYANKPLPGTSFP